ncbi:MAG: type II toxin-antitoxin system HicA family toxin [Dehalococcoidia bacterium]
MGKLPQVRPIQAERAILKDGWFFARSGRGSHRHYLHPSKPGVVTISFHPGPIRIWTLRSIIRQAALTEQQFLALL